MRLKDEAKEQRIKEKAIEMIVSQGLDGFSMKELAKACSISVSTIYVYYKNKEELFFQLILQLRTEQLQDSVRGLHADMGFEEGLHLQWQNRFNYFIVYPLNVQALERLKYTPEFHQTTPHLIKELQPDLGKFTENAIKRGELAKMPFELLWALGFSPLYALIEFHLAGSSYASSQFSLTPELITAAIKKIAVALKP